MGDLKINLDVYIQLTCTSAALCDSQKGDEDPLNMLTVIVRT